MSSDENKTCAYVGRSGRACEGLADSNSGLCYWHDDSIAKQNDTNLVARLEDWAKAGHLLEGLKLARTNLNNLNLQVDGPPVLCDCDFYRADLSNAHLYGADLQGASLMKAKVTNANLNAADLRDANLLGVKWSSASIERVRWGSMILQERMGHTLNKQGKRTEARQTFIEAEEIYRHLYVYCAAKGLYNETSHFFCKERIMQRHQMKKGSTPWLLSILVDRLCGYGENPSRVITFAITVIFGFSLIYYLFGLNGPEGQIGLFYASGVEYLTHYLSSLYFSVVTYTTLGYGDITPTGIGRFFASLQAFIGAFTIALFVVVFMKKMTR